MVQGIKSEPFTLCINRSGGKYGDSSPGNADDNQHRNAENVRHQRDAERRAPLAKLKMQDTAVPHPPRNNDGCSGEGTCADQVEDTLDTDRSPGQERGDQRGQWNQNGKDKKVRHERQQSSGRGRGGSIVSIPRASVKGIVLRLGVELRLSSDDVSVKGPGRGIGTVDQNQGEGDEPEADDNGREDQRLWQRVRSTGR